MRVVAVDDLSGGVRRNLPRHPAVQFVQGDVKDAAFLGALFQAHGGFDYVYHLAAFASEGCALRPAISPAAAAAALAAEGWACWRRLSHFVRSYIYRTNLVGSAELINAALKANVSCFVFTSSIAVYGAGAGAGALSVRAQAQPLALLTRGGSGRGGRPWPHHERRRNPHRGGHTLP